MNIQADFNTWRATFKIYLTHCLGPLSSQLPLSAT